MFSIRVLYSGSINADECFHFYGQKPGRLIDSPSFFYLLNDGKHKILVDTGMESKEAVESHFPHIVDIPHTMGELLELAGTSPSEIEAVIFTHLHWDHIGNAGLFGNARLFARKEEIERAFDPDNKDEAYRRYYSRYLFALKERCEAVDDTFDLYPGIRLLWTGGHSEGSQCVLVETNEGRVALPGDCIARYKNYEEKIPAGSVTSLEEAVQAIDTIIDASDVILPSHDWHVFDHEKVIGGPDPVPYID